MNAATDRLTPTQVEALSRFLRSWAHQGSELLTSGTVAEQMGVSRSTLQRWLATGVIPEPDWVSSGDRRARIYSDAWASAVRRLLAAGSYDSSASGLLVPTLSGYRGSYEGLYVSVELSANGLTVTAEFLASLDRLYERIFAFIADRPPVPTERMRIATLSMASPLEAAAVVAGTGKAADAAKATAGAIETVATLRSKRRIANEEADFAEETHAARVTQAKASARKALAEAVASEEAVVHQRVVILREAIALAKELGDPELLAKASHALSNVLGGLGGPGELQGIAAETVLLVDQVEAISAVSTSAPALEEGADNSGH